MCPLPSDWLQASVGGREGTAGVSVLGLAVCGGGHAVVLGALHHRSRCCCRHDMIDAQMPEGWALLAAGALQAAAWMSLHGQGQAAMHVIRVNRGSGSLLFRCCELP